MGIRFQTWRERENLEISGNLNGDHLMVTGGHGSTNCISAYL